MNYRVKTIVLSLCAASLMTISADTILDISSGEIFSGQATSDPVRTANVSEDRVSMTYHFDYANVTTFSGDMVNISIPGFNQFGEPGEPAVLGRRDIFNVSSLGNFSISITESSYIEVPMELAPIQQPLTDMDVSVREITTMTAYDGFFPKEVVTASNPYTVRDGVYADVIVSPIQYDYARKIVRIYSDISYELTAGQQVLAMSKAITTEEKVLSEDMESIVVNPDIQYATQSNNGRQDLGMLIVTSEKLATSTTDFREHKRRLGLRTYQLEFENATEKDIPKITSAIRGQMELHKDIKYLLILGDDKHIPAYQIKDYVKTGHALGDTFLTDLYYVCDNIPKKIDSIYSTVAYMPAVARGRIPVSTGVEAKIVLDKIIKYEIDPPTNSNFYDTYLMSTYFQQVDHTYYTKPKLDGREQYSYEFTETTEGINSILENEVGKNVIRYNTRQKTYKYVEDSVTYVLDLPTPLKWSNGKIIPKFLQDPGFYEHTEGGFEKDFINKGTSIYYYFGHGGISAAIGGWFTTKAIPHLTNGDMQPVVFGVSCYLGAYHRRSGLKTSSGEVTGDYENFGRAFLNRQGGGCVGFIGATHVSYCYPNFTFAKALFEVAHPYYGFMGNDENCTYLPTTRMGNIMDRASLIVGLNHGNSMRTIHWEYYHYLGDPSMRLRTKNPDTNHNTAISIKKATVFGTQYFLNVNSGNATEFALYEDGKAPLRFEGSINNFEISNPENTHYTLCINGDNLKPEFVTLSSEYFETENSNYLNVTYSRTTKTITAKFRTAMFKRYNIIVYDSMGGILYKMPYSLLGANTEVTHELKIDTFSISQTAVVVLFEDNKVISSKTIAL